MKKTVFTVCVDDYFPELCELTLPNIEAYATRIGARFQLITDRKYPEFPPTYEKLQVHELGKDNKWNILVDADMLIAPTFWDVTQVIPEDSIGIYMSLHADKQFPRDIYFARDGRNMGIVTNFVVTSDLCHDVWTPFEEPASEILPRMKRPFIVDEYCLSRNTARFGLKVTGVIRGDREEQLHLDVTTTGGDRTELLARARAYLEACELSKSRERHDLS